MSDLPSPPGRRSFLAMSAGAVAGLIVAPTASAQFSGFRAPVGSMRQWATIERISLWDGLPPNAGTFQPGQRIAGMPEHFVNSVAHPLLHVVRPRRSNGRAVLILPGGSYFIESVLAEGLDVARRLAAVGYTAFVLTYRLPGEGWTDRADVPLQDAQRAMRIVQMRARSFGVDPTKIAALGFSAGGHLAATLATNFAETVYSPRDASDALEARPAAVGLIYPVVAMSGPTAHAFSASMLLGPRPDAATVARRSPERHVTSITPPAFVVHAVNDDTVLVRNSIDLLEAYRAARRPVEAHFFAEGGHGFGLGTMGSREAEWPKLFEQWLNHLLA